MNWNRPDPVMHGTIALFAQGLAISWGSVEWAAALCVVQLIGWPAREWWQNGPPSEWGENAWPEAVVPMIAAVGMFVLTAVPFIVWGWL